jgi:hypothetical protein
MQNAERELGEREQVMERLHTRIAALEEDVQSSSVLASGLLDKDKKTQEQCRTLVCPLI